MAITTGALTRAVLVYSVVRFIMYLQFGVANYYLMPDLMPNKTTTTLASTTSNVYNTCVLIAVVMTLVYAAIGAYTRESVSANIVFAAGSYIVDMLVFGIYATSVDALLVYANLVNIGSDFI